MENLWIGGGRVYTMDPRRPEAESVYIENGIIRGLDLSREEAERLSEASGRATAEAGSGLKVIDLAGRCLLPGFHDSHLHMIAYGATQTDCVDLSGARSVAEVQELLRKHIRENEKKPGSWVIGSGWNHEKFTDKRMPKREDLDAVSTEHYIFIKRVCIHIAAVNSKVLELCGLESGTDVGDAGTAGNAGTAGDAGTARAAAESGGVLEDSQEIGRDEGGRPNGLIFEDAINNVVLIHRPPYGEEEISRIILKTAEGMKQSGFTTIQTDDMKAFADEDSKKNILKAYDRLRNEGRLPLRIIEQVQVSSLAELEAIMEVAAEIENDDWFSIKTIKVLLDGSLGGWTAAVNRPYADNPEAVGVLNFTDEELYRIGRYCRERDLQLACHAIGDRAIDQLLTLTNRLEEEFGAPLPGKEPRIVHCQLSSYEQIEELSRLSFLADIQPTFVPSDFRLVEERIGKEEQRSIYAWHTLLEKGIGLAGSSDCPVETYLPFYGIRAAVCRNSLEGEPAGGWRPFEKLTVKEALALYTTGAARSVGEENRRGMIREGFLADLAVTDRDPYETEPEHLHEIKVEEVICGGRCQSESSM